MFSRKSHGDVKKSTQKVLDPKKDVLTRFKHLRSLLDILEWGDLKQFFEVNYSQIYFIFFENFIALESNLKQKGNKSQREELDSILFLFEKILQLLPERIYCRWQFHSIGSILKKLLHTGNSLKLRCEGIRLFLLWLQALQTNCSEEQVLIFACLVPGFPAILSSNGSCTLENLISPSYPLDAKITPEEITPLLPPASDKISEDQTCSFLQIILKYMVIQAASLEWRNKENKDTGFKFLFTLFRKYYLPYLFPSLTKLTNVYKPDLDIPHFRPKPTYVAVNRNSENTYSTKDQYMGARVTFIKWLVTFFLEKKYITATQNTKNGGDALPKIIQEKTTESEPNGPSEQEKNHSNSSTLSDRRLSNSSLCSIEEEHRSVYEMVQRILLSTRNYVNFVNEIFHQAFLLPPCDVTATRKVIKVYRKWILQDKPVFMEEPEKVKSGQDSLENSEDLLLTEVDSKEAPEHTGHRRTSSWGRTYSFTSAVNRGCVLETENEDVKAGVQTTLQVLLEENDCTLIVAWIRANLSVYISRDLWDELLSVLSSLTSWEELISEWAYIMDSLTVMLARSVYGLDMTNLPLDKLSEQKEKKQRGRGVVQDVQKGSGVGRSFSLSWRSHPDVQEPMRFRSATTSGAPGVEKARNIVRQKATAKRSQSISNCVHLYEALPTTKSVPLLLHTVSSLLPGISYTSCSPRLSEVEEALPTENAGPDVVISALTSEQEQQLTRSSSTSDITEQLSDIFPGQKKDNFQNIISDARTGQDGKAFVKKENETPVILIRRSSSPAEFEYRTDTTQQLNGRPGQREKSESISSETSNSNMNETEFSVMPWQTFEEEPIPQSDVSFDPDTTCHWLHVSSSGTGTLTGFGSFLPTQTDTCSQPHLSSAPLPFQVKFDCKDSVPLLDENMHKSVLYMPEDLDSSECLADDCSIIAGGNLTGWHPDAAAVLWRRILGILGDVNSIRCPKIHAKVFSYLYDLWHRLAKVRENLAISLDNQSSPPPPVLIPPLRMFASWLFKATTMPDEYKEGKIQAYRLICDMMMKRQDVLPNSDFLVHFYHVMHKGFISEDQDVLNTIIRHCSPHFFFLGLPGFTMLVGDFITAAARVLSTDMLEAPRLEAQIILGSLVCFPNLYQQMPLLQSVSNTTDIISGDEDIKYYLVNILLKNARNEPSEAARCIAICSLGVWICEELVQCTNHPQVKDAINVIGVTLKFSNKMVAQVACDVLQLLASYWEKLRKHEPYLPKKITEILVATIAFLLPSAEHSSVETDKKLMVLLLLCLLDWCMALPLDILLEPISTAVLDDQHSQKGPLLDYIYRVLHCCVHGSNTYTQQSHYLLSLADLSSIDYDPFLTLGNVKNTEPVQCHSTVDFGNLLTVAEEKRRRNLELIPLTARMVMTHLVNHLGHYPLCGGPAVLHSLICENHDNSYVESSELSSEVFKSPNLQLFVFNESTLISYLQMPIDRNAAGDPTVATTDVRVLVRDISGKYSWDGRILYGPLEGYVTSYKDHSVVVPSGSDLTEHHLEAVTSDSVFVEPEEDMLDKLLEDLGNSSPECLLHPQLKLNEPAPPPFGMSRDQEKDIIEAILKQSTQEEDHISRWSRDLSMEVAIQKKPSPQEPQAPFYFCRLLLNDLGMNSWDRRKSFHLLKKNSKLLRELKNLDSRQCRETHKIAVFYIAEGQEDKCSILSNTGGSQAYEDFVSGLGWEVDLSTHCGFMGGLQRNGSTGQTAPYYATSTVEAIFHVSTRMPSDSDDSLTKKLRHLGNDEVHIVWSEHTRNYRRGIIPTDFGDVLIIIYPMKNHMFFIQIMKKPEVPFFGPLFNGAIVTEKLLPSLVRATCINASRAVKSLIPLYQSFYEERALYLEAIVQNHREVMTFEDFAAQVFSPSPSYYSLSGTESRTWKGVYFDMNYPWSKFVYDVHSKKEDQIPSSAIIKITSLNIQIKYKV
nr:PREDICTED: ral GTPase-activating protein subunit alpha-2 [Latimeria chalumnae]|eukprot:XP_014350838.1 PREDICTED: ral GTPase-activating protein subunit alpha-2 [Latimeria chalumnae]